MEEERDRLLRFAYLYYKRGEIRKASSYCEQFLAKYPDDPEALELMGDIEVEQAKLQDSLFYYKKALQIDPSRREIEGKIAKIEKELEEVERMIQPSSTSGFPRVYRTSLGIAENVEGFLCYFFPGYIPLHRHSSGEREQIRQIPRNSIPSSISRYIYPSHTIGISPGGTYSSHTGCL